MAVIVPIDKLRKGFNVIAQGNDPIVVQLRNTQTVYRDRDTGWTIRGAEKKELLVGPTGTPSPSLLAAIRAGRFVKVEVKKGKKSKAQDLVEYIAGQSALDKALDENPPEPVGKTPSKTS